MLRSRYTAGGDLEFYDDEAGTTLLTVAKSGTVTLGTGGTIDTSAGTLTANETTPSADALDGSYVKNVADKNVLGGIPVVHRVAVASGANADVDTVLTEKTRVIDAWAVLKGAGTAGSLITVKNGATAITDAMDVSAGGDKAVFRAGTIDDAAHEIDAAGTLRVSKASTGGDFPGAEVYVLGLKVA